MSLLGTYTQPQRDKLASWLAAVTVALMCIIFGSTWVGFLRVYFPAIESVTQITGANLSWPVRFLLATHSWLLPLFFYSAAVFTIVKEGLIRDSRTNRIWNGTIFAVVTVVVGLVQLALYLQTQQIDKAVNH
jgi:hypothetical protein